MRIVVFGATGGIGRLVVEEALARDHQVRAVVRDPARIATHHARLSITRADVMDPDSLRGLLDDGDAVISALGSPAWSGTEVRSKGTANVVRAMEAAGASRLVSVSTLGVGESWACTPLRYRLLFRTFLQAAFRAHERQEALIRGSGLAWTLVRPGEFTDGPLTGAYRHGFPPDDHTVAARISRADVAHFLVSEVEAGRYVRETVGLSY